MNTTGQISGTAITTSSGAEMETKTCSKCKREKPLTQFSKDKSKKDGHKYVCKLCAKVRDKAYREANREKLKARKKAYRESNPEKIKALSKAWYEANREKIKARKKAYREANREEINAWQKAYRESNPEKIKAYREANREEMKAYREANREKLKALSKAYYEANREKISARQKVYKQSPRGKFFRVKTSAKVRGIEFLLTEEQGIEMIKKPCTYCGKPKSSGIDRIDSNGVYTIENCEPCCGTCNNRKGTKSKEVFLQEIKEGKWN